MKKKSILGSVFLTLFLGLIFLTNFAEASDIAWEHGSSVKENVVPDPCSGQSWNSYQKEKFNNLPADGITILADHYDDFSHSDYDGNAEYTVVPVVGQSFSEVLQVKIKSKPSSDYRVNMTLGTPTALKQDDVILVSFYARAMATSGQTEFLFMRASEPWTNYVTWPLDIDTEWKKFYIPFSVEVWREMVKDPNTAKPPDGYDDKTFTPNEVRFRFSLGYHPQTLQFADMKVVNYGSDLDGSLLPYSCIDEGDESVLVINDGESCIPQLLADAESGARYLPDFSYAGYHFGNEPIPTGNNSATVLSVINYGASPNDASDDTVAIQNAISAAENKSGSVILEFPAGKFKLSEIIFLKRSNFIVRGAGNDSNGTILEILQPMKDMIKPPEILYMEQTSTHSPFSWTGGVVWIKNDDHVPAAKLATITGSSARGSHSVTVNNASILEAGKVLGLRYYQNNSSDSIQEHVFNCTNSDLPDGFGQALPPTYDGGSDAGQVVTIESIDGNQITFKEPLNHDIRAEWEGQLRDIGFVEEVGFEGFRIEFPKSIYQGHHSEEGYNGIYMHSAIHSWIKDVEITNSDSGIIVNNSKNITVTNIKITGRGGHYSLCVGNSDQVLFRDFVITARALHNPSFNTYNRTGVYTHGAIDFVQFDQHNGMNHQNLFDDLTLTGYVRKLWNHGGNSTRRPTHAAYNTSWNLQFHPDQHVPVHGTNIFDGPSAYMVGLTSSAALIFKYGPNLYQECIGKELTTPSLYEYQLNKRLEVSPTDTKIPTDTKVPTAPGNCGLNC